MNGISKRIAIAMAFVAAFGGSVLAETLPPTDAATSTPPTTVTPVTTGSIDTEPPFEQRMKDCMAIWDKGTHMNKEQWHRSCRTTLQSLEPKN